MALMAPALTAGKPRELKSCSKTVVEPDCAGNDTLDEVGAPVIGAGTVPEGSTKRTPCGNGTYCTPTSAPFWSRMTRPARLWAVSTRKVTLRFWLTASTLAR